MMTSSNNQFTYQGYEFKSHTLPLIFLIFICFWSFFYNIVAIEMDSMEARNLVTAREILENNNWLVPTMNGEVRLAKPPLPTWFAALVSLSVGGTDDLALLRLPSALSALTLIFFTYGLAWSMSRNRTLAFMAAAMLATNVLMMKMGHRATWDIFCHTFMLGAIWAFMSGMRGNRNWPVFAIFGALMGLSFMSKGPVSFFALFLPFILSYLWIFKAREIRKNWPLIALAVAICLVISSLWPLYIWNFHPEALLATANQESEAWISRHVKPFWYYSNFPVFSGLWLVVAIAVLIKPFAEKRVKSIQDYRFLLLWLVLEILLLSVLPEKKARYLLPAMIPLALLGGTLFHGIMDSYNRGKQENGDVLIIALHTSLLSIFGIIFPGYLFYQIRIVNELESIFPLIVIFAVYLAMIAFAWLLFSKKNVLGLFFLTAVQFCFMAFLHMDYYPDVGIPNPEYKRMVDIDPTLLPAEMDVFIIEKRTGVRIPYVWDLKRRIRSWHVDEVKPLLERGKTVALISAGEPYQELVKSIDEDVVVQTIGRFDYNENRPQKEKIFLSRVSLKE